MQTSLRLVTAAAVLLAAVLLLRQVLGTADGPRGDALAVEGSRADVGAAADLARGALTQSEPAPVAERREAADAAVREALSAEAAPGSVRVRAVDERGRPLRSVSVQWFALGAEAASARPADGAIRPGAEWSWGGITDADGEQILTELEPGRYRFTAGRSRYWLYSFSDVVEVSPTVGHVVELVLRAPAADRRVVGQVLDPKGEPVRGARVEFAWRDALDRARRVETTSGSDGRFTLIVVPAARGGVRASHGKLFRSDFAASVVAGGPALTLRLGELKLIAIETRSERGEVLLGSVQLSYRLGGVWTSLESAGRRPARLEVVDLERLSFAGSSSALLEWALPRAPVRIMGSATGYAPATIEAEDPDSLDEVVRLVLTKSERAEPALLTGTVTLDGAPASEARVCAVPEGRTEAVEAPATVVDVGRGGRFAIPVNGADTYRVTAWRRGQMSGAVTTWFDPAASSEPIEIELDTPLGQVEGHVIVSSGQDPSAVRLRVRHGSVRMQPDDAGAFRVEAPAGRHTLVAQVTRIAPRAPGEPLGRWKAPRRVNRFALTFDVDVHAGEALTRDLDLTAEQGVRVSGALAFDGAGLLGEADKPQGWTPEVQLAPVGRAGAGAGFLTETGTFEVQGQGPGDYDLRLSLALPSSTQLELVERLHLLGGKRDWSYRTATGSVRVELPLGLVDVTAVSLRSVSAQPRVTVTSTQGGGSCFFPRVPTGRFEVVPRDDPWGASVLGVVDVLPGELTEVRVP